MEPTSDYVISTVMVHTKMLTDYQYHTPIGMQGVHLMIYPINLKPMDVPLLVELGGEMHGLLPNVIKLIIAMLVNKVGLPCKMH